MNQMQVQKIQEQSVCSSILREAFEKVQMDSSTDLESVLQVLGF